MYYLLAAFSGFLVSVMIVFNGQLTSYYGLYSGTLLIHLIGLIFITLIMLFKREPFKIKEKVPFYSYCIGAVTYASVILNNFSFGHISITAIVALGLLGQITTSLVIDSFGLFNMEKKKFKLEKLIGLFIILLGIIIMIGKVPINKFIPILFAFLVGLPIVLSRTLSADLAKKTTLLQGTFYTYASAVVASLIFAIFLSPGEPIFSGIKLNGNILIYLGGMIGVAVVFVCNIAVIKISSFDMTILQFIGQSFTGIILDIMLSGSFSSLNFIGSIFVTLGLIVNVMVDKKLSKSK